jgi:hypothetical protein
MSERIFDHPTGLRIQAPDYVRVIGEIPDVVVLVDG